jgi:hypothetical protein
LQVADQQDGFGFIRSGEQTQSPLTIQGSGKLTATADGAGSMTQFILVSGSQLSFSGGEISLQTNGIGNEQGGNIFLSGSIANTSEKLSLTSDGAGTGRGGLITVLNEVGSLTLNDKFAFHANGGSAGSGGMMFIRAGQNLALNNSPVDFAPGSNGNGGSFSATAVTGKLTIQTSINSDGAGNGNGGTIFLQGKSIDLMAQDLTARSGANGTGGSITAIASASKLTVNSTVQVDASGTGNGGSIYLQGNTTDLRSSLSARSGSNGSGGNITVLANTGKLSVGNPITADGAGNGNGGNIFLRANALELRTSRIGANGGESGNGGSISTTANSGNIVTQTTLTASGGSGGGRIELFAGNGNVAVGGNLEASGTGQNASGKTISITAGSTKKVTVNGEISLNGTGTGSGGTLSLIGGSALATASKLSATGGDSGNGGKVLVTTTSGNLALNDVTVLATGGHSGGEVTIFSGIGTVAVKGTVNASSTNGTAGQSGSIGMSAPNNKSLTIEGSFLANGTHSGNGGNITALGGTLKVASGTKLSADAGQDAESAGTIFLQSSNSSSNLTLKTVTISAANAASLHTAGTIDINAGRDVILQTGNVLDTTSRDDFSGRIFITAGSTSNKGRILIQGSHDVLGDSILNAQGPASQMIISKGATFKTLGDVDAQAESVVVQGSFVSTAGRTLHLKTKLIDLRGLIETKADQASIEVEHLQGTTADNLVVNSRQGIFKTNNGNAEFKVLTGPDNSLVFKGNSTFEVGDGILQLTTVTEGQLQNILANGDTARLKVESNSSVNVVGTLSIHSPVIEVAPGASLKADTVGGELFHLFNNGLIRAGNTLAFANNRIGMSGDGRLESGDVFAILLSTDFPAERLDIQGQRILAGNITILSTLITMDADSRMVAQTITLRTDSFANEGILEARTAQPDESGITIRNIQAPLVISGSGTLLSNQLELISSFGTSVHQQQITATISGQVKSLALETMQGVLRVNQIQATNGNIVISGNGPTVELVNQVDRPGFLNTISGDVSVQNSRINGTIILAPTFSIHAGQLGTGNVSIFTGGAPVQVDGPAPTSITYEGDAQHGHNVFFGPSGISNQGPMTLGVEGAGQIIFSSNKKSQINVGQDAVIRSGSFSPIGYVQFSGSSHGLRTFRTPTLMATYSEEPDIVFQKGYDLRINAGEVLLTSIRPSTLSAGFADIDLAAGSTVLVRVERNGSVVVSNLCDKHENSVKVVCSSVSLFVGVGSDMSICEAGNLETSNPTVGRRSKKQIEIGGKRITTSDISVLSLLGNNRLLRGVNKDRTNEIKRLTQRILKTAAALQLVTSSRGRYESQPKVAN